MLEEEIGLKISTEFRNVGWSTYLSFMCIKFESENNLGDNAISFRFKNQPKDNYYLVYKSMIYPSFKNEYLNKCFIVRRLKINHKYGMELFYCLETKEWITSIEKFKNHMDI